MLSVLLICWEAVISVNSTSELYFLHFGSFSQMATKLKPSTIPISPLFGQSPVDIHSLIWKSLDPPPTPTPISTNHFWLSNHHHPPIPKRQPLTFPLSGPHQLFLWPFWETSLLSQGAVGLLSLRRLTALQWLSTLLRCVLPVTVAQSNGPPAW